MKITVLSSKTVKPAANGVVSAAATNAVPLTVFDNATYNKHISGINFFLAPTPPNAALMAGLARALAEYRHWAGRLGVDADGKRTILLTDAGARFVEAAADVALDDGVMALALEPAPEVRSLHPSGDGSEELMLVQITRFACGSVAIGHTMHHAVADGRAISNFLLALGQATRGVAMDPAPVHDRASLFVPRCPPRVEFDHRRAEFKSPGAEHKAADCRCHGARAGDGDDEEVVVRRVQYSPEFIAKLKSLAGTCSTFQCVAAHLWRCIMAARGLAGDEVTTLRVAVDGRARMHHPRVLEGYTGNVVLSARPAITAGKLLTWPLPRVTELISRAVARVDDAYFRSFVDFASSGAVEKEGLVPMDDAEEAVCSPDVEVDSLLHVPFQDLDFGGGPSFFFMPSYLPVEGSVFVMRSFRGDRSVDAYVPLFRSAMAAFNACFFSLHWADDERLC